MADDNTGEKPTDAAQAQDAQPEGPAMRIQRVFIKDVSFESPQTPDVFLTQTNWQPHVSLHLNTDSKKHDNDIYECVLTVTVTVKLEDDVVYLVEVKQAGLFLIKGFDEQRMGAMLGSFCPNVLFPFAREEIASLVQKGGFPQLVLDPVNFDALYAQHLQNAREGAQQNAPAPDTRQ